eukprot:3661224-Prymnesium_polylepis.1
MRRENENLRAKVNEDCRATLAQLKRQTDEAQRAASRVQEACALFKVALARFKLRSSRSSMDPLRVAGSRGGRVDGARE